MKPSVVVINPDNGIIYGLSVANTFYPDAGGCYTYQNTFDYDVMNKQIFDELMSDENEGVRSFFDDMNRWFYKVLVLLMIAIIVIYFGWMGYAFAVMSVEGFVATLIVWIIVSLLKCCNVFGEFGGISPSFKEIWRINVLLCVPDFSFVRILQFTEVGLVWRVSVRIVLTVLLLIDIYQNDPPHDKQS